MMHTLDARRSISPGSVSIEERWASAGVSHPSDWFFVPKPLARPLTRLFCFPYACGSVQIFRSWISALPEFVELVAMQLPGRGSRLTEACFVQIGPAADQAADAIAQLGEPNVMLFGHSMGALLAYEVTRRLEERYALIPQCLLVSGYKSPTTMRTGHKYHLCDDTEFIAKIRELGATPDAILNDPEAMEFLLPAFRSDFAMAENYPFGPVKQHLRTEIIAFAGDQDSEASLDQVAAWRETTTAPFEMRAFAGGHFFIHDNEPEFLAALSQEIKKKAVAFGVRGEERP